MSYIAGQAAGPIGLNFFVDTHEWPCYMKKKIELFFEIFKNSWSNWAEFFCGHSWVAVVKDKKSKFFSEIFKIKKIHGKRRVLQLWS